jgi:hypothetical protein
MPILYYIKYWQPEEEIPMVTEFFPFEWQAENRREELLKEVEERGGEKFSSIYYKGNIGKMAFLWRGRGDLADSLNKLNEIYNT